MTRLVYAYFKKPKPSFNFFWGGEDETEYPPEGWYLVARVDPKDNHTIDNLKKEYKTLKMRDVDAKLPLTHKPPIVKCYKKDDIRDFEKYLKYDISDNSSTYQWFLPPDFDYDNGKEGDK